ncbi:hypothetical protein Tco_1207596 [Tanacetum coccineum]
MILFTAELERYKEQVKVLKEGQNDDLKCRENVSDSCEQSVEIDRLKQTLYEQLKEKESLMQTVTLLKNNFKKEESRNIDREIALEKKIKQLDNMNHSPSCRPTKVEVPKELPKVSMVNMSLNKLKHHIAGFDVVVKERTTPTTITEGSWGFEHTKACFRDEIIPFVKAVNDIFNTFDQYLIDELTEVQNIFHQMEQAVEQHQCLLIETELLNKKDFNEKETYDKLFRSYTTLEKHCISLEVNTQLNQEIFQRDNSVSNQSAPNFNQYFELNELKAQSQEKDTVIRKLKERNKSLSENMNDDKVKMDIKEIETINIELDHRVSKLIAENEARKNLANNVVTKHTIALEMLKVDVEPIAPKLLNSRTVHSDYLRHTQEQAAILREIVEQGHSENPLDISLYSACKYTKRIQELLIIIRQTCPSIKNLSDKLVAVTPKNKDKRVRFTEPTTSSGNTNIKTSSSSNIVSNKPMLSSTGHSKLNANSEHLCVKCNGCMLTDNHDLRVLDFINDVNARVKSKSVKKSSKRKVWKPTGKGFTNIGYTWRPTGRTFTIVENACPLTRITTTAEVPFRKPTALENDTPKPLVTLIYSKKPRKTKTNVPASKPKIVKSISANNKEPNKSWGSTVSNVPSSSLDECKLSKLFSGIWTIGLSPSI